MVFTTSYCACDLNISYDIVEHQARTGGGNDPAPTPQRVSTWAEPFLCFVYYFNAAQSAGMHETRACPFVDAQNGHGHVRKDSQYAN
jgi:hypothetical protein